MLPTQADILPEKVRVIVTSDIGFAERSQMKGRKNGDPDDRQSMVRLLLHANELKILGLVSALSCSNDTHDPENFYDFINGYAEVLPNLQAHAALLPEPFNQYPSAQSLRAVVRDGSDKETPAFLYEQIRADDSPVWLLAWGGLAPIFEALNYAKDQPDYEEIIGRVRIYSNTKQDMAEEQAPFRPLRPMDDGKLVPDIEYALARAHSGVSLFLMSHGQYLGMSDSVQVKDWIGPIPEFYQNLFNDGWVRENVQSQGNFGALYTERIYIYEGDSPSFMHLLPGSPGNPDQPGWGGWGGRFVPQYPEQEDLAHKWINDSGGLASERAVDSFEGVANVYVPIWRWREAYQNELAARIQWTLSSNPEKANHPPIIESVRVNGREAGRIAVAEGEHLKLEAWASDPDGDELKYRWFIYPEPSGYKGPTNIIEDPHERSTVLSIPPKTGAGEIHLLLEVRDLGQPELVRCARKILDVRP